MTTEKKTDTHHNDNKKEDEADDKKEADATFKAGDKVSWDSSQGTIHGTVEKKVTEPMDIKKHHVAASPENPEYLVKSDKTGAEAAHKPAELHKEK